MTMSGLFSLRHILAESGIVDADGDSATTGDTDDEQAVLTSIGQVATPLETARRRRLDTRLTFPVQPDGGLIVLNNFGGNSVSNGPCSHRGIDVFPTDDLTKRPLLACVDGIIEGQRFAGSSGSQGNAWILQDGNGVSYRYHHIDEFAEGLEVGSPVRRGDVIARMGTSGNANSAHLHFEVRPDGASSASAGFFARAASTSCRRSSTSCAAT